MLPRSRIFAAFAFVQLLGLGCSWLWNHPPSAVSSFLWGAAFLTLFPGNILGAVIVERLFWHSRLSLPTMGVMTTVVLVAINAFVWAVVALMIGAIRRRVRSAKVE